MKKETYLDREHAERKAEKLRVNIQSQLDSRFYKEVDEFMEEIKMQQLFKAAETYPKPFDPADFTAEQLVTHFMQENYDQRNYGYGLYKKIKEMQEQIAHLEKQLEDQTQNTAFWFAKSLDLQKLLKK